MPDGLFIFFAALTLGAALLLVLSRNAVTSAMGMILALVGIAAGAGDWRRAVRAAWLAAGAAFVAWARTSRAPKPEELAVLKKLDLLNAARVLLNLDETLTKE